MDQLARACRRFAIIALVAGALLTPGIASAAAGSPDKLQVLVNETAAQLQLAYRQHPDERARRQEQLMAAVAAWRTAPRNEANNERLANWLRVAISSSMPGSKDALPAVPSFAAVVKTEPQVETPVAPVEPQPVETAVEKKAPAEAVAQPNDDPFRDDPETESK